MEYVVEIITKGILGAFSVVGVIQYLKNFIVDKGKRYAIIMPFVTVAVVAAFYLLPIWVGGCLFTFALGQLLWENVLQVVKAWVDNSRKKNE